MAFTVLAAESNSKIVRWNDVQKQVTLYKLFVPEN